MASTNPATLMQTSLGVYKALLAVGLTTSSYFLFGNIGSARYGLLGVTTSEAERKATQLDVRKSVREWLPLAR